MANPGVRVVAGPDVLCGLLAVLNSSTVNPQHRRSLAVTAAACIKVSCATMISSKPLLASLLNEIPLLQYFVHWILRRSMALRRFLSGGSEGPSPMQVDTSNFNVPALRTDLEIATRVHDDPFI